MLNEVEFTSRLEAALAIRKEREGREDRSGTGHLSKKSKYKDDESSSISSSRSMKLSVQSSSQISSRGKNNRRRKPAFATVRGSGGVTEVVEDVKQKKNVIITQDQTMIDKIEEDEEPPEINPCQCPFDSHISTTPTTNLHYMKTHYSFFLPDYEYITDLEGFLGYCNEKVRWGTTCLYCQKSFTSAEGTVKHMRDKRHCKILYETGVDMEEYDVFYDFTSMYDNDDEDGKRKEKKKNIGKKQNTIITSAMDVEDEEGDDAHEDDEEEWEDVSSDDDKDEGGVMNESDDDDINDDDDDDDDIYATYEREINTRGIDITPLGELIFPDGRIVGHRGLARYYKQRFAPDRMDRAAVRHAKEASGDRLYHGRVVNLHRLYGEDNTTTDGRGGVVSVGTEGGEQRGRTTTALAIMGRISGSIPTGRNGKGILVSAGGGDNNNKGGNFTSLSLYRYRAAVKKQRKEDDRGKRLQYRQTMNMNKMNKKGNNITTGVVTSQQPR
jgi:pre-60S factor REI1